MNLRNFLLSLLVTIFFSACSRKDSHVPVIGFADAFEDQTISQAKAGFFDALEKKGFSEENHTIKVIYRNAQGDIPTLTQIINYFISEKVNLIASNTTLATITAIQRTKDIPVFMMVSPVPGNMKVLDKKGEAPANLFGVAEDLAYIDTSFTLIQKLLNAESKKLRVGMIYNQAESQSVDALNRIRYLASKNNIAIEALPLNSSADAQLVTQSLLDRGIDAFFANPDNTIFASFETIVKNCNQRNVPVFTSEAGLVKRGAVAAFGADIYQWGYQAGLQAAEYLKSGKTDNLQWEMVKVRKRVYSPSSAEKYKIIVPANFEALK